MKGDSDRLNVNRTIQKTGPYDTACGILAGLGDGPESVSDG